MSSDGLSDHERSLNDEALSTVVSDELSTSAETASNCSDPEESHSEEEHIRDTFARHLELIHSAGSFATFGRVQEFALPGISVDPIGVVRLPLSEGDACALAKASRQAPFGRGTQTLVDESVRKTWEIDATAIRFMNSAWKSCVNWILKRVCKELGVIGGSQHVRAELYKMLLYEKGAMFKPHRDTEKAPGMFGTLVISLPSEHIGGSVCLRHGNKMERFSTDISSAFDASYLAWYADVTHEVDEVQRGYRWVLTYNLINEVKELRHSASMFDTRSKQLIQMLSRWQLSQARSQYLAWPLDHKYTNAELNLLHLKGNDYHRVRHVAQGCETHGAFYVLLANMERCVTDANNEESYKDSRTSELSLSYIVDLEGFKLSLTFNLTIQETQLLRDIYDEDRKADQQWGGEYTGNQYAEIDRFYKDSAMFVIPKPWLASFLLGRAPQYERVIELIARFKKRMENKSDDPTSREFLLQICRILLLSQDTRSDHPDLFLGPVASTAAYLGEATVFDEALDRMRFRFDQETYQALGTSISIGNSFLPEEKIIQVLTKSGKLHEIYDNIRWYQEGFSRGNANRDDHEQVQQLKVFLDEIVLKSLEEANDACAADAKALIRIINDFSNDQYEQRIDTGLRTFVGKHAHHGSFTIASVVELLRQGNYRNGRQPRFEFLLQVLLEPFVQIFDLHEYAFYNRSAYPCTGPIEELYERLGGSAEHLSTQMLDKIRVQAPSLAPDYLQNFVPTLAEKMVAFMDSSLPSTKEFVYSLLTTYITKVVEKEPEKPGNWARLGELPRGSCYTKDCRLCPSVDEFLESAEAETMTVFCDNEWHLRHRYTKLLYSQPDRTPADAANKQQLTLTKTTEWWEEQHHKWERRASEALLVIGKFPQLKLKECLGDRYDEIIGLDMVKAESDGCGNSESAKQHNSSQSTVPQKRKWG